MLLPRPRFLFAVSAFAILSLVGLAVPSQAQTNITIETSLGDIDIELLDGVRPVSVNNFLNYVLDGDYTDTIIHRAPNPDFVIQGGGFTIDAQGLLGSVPTDAAFQDTPGPSNIRGTLAMAENALGATSQWFINVTDNTGLDPDFTVFGEVDTGMDVVDAIAALPIFSFNPAPPFGEVPLRNYTTQDAMSGVTPGLNNFVIVHRVVVVPEPSSALLGLGALAALARLRERSPLA